MTVERAVRMIAGVFVLLSLALGHYVHPYWYFFTAFVGLKFVPIGVHQLVPDDDDPAEVWDEVGVTAWTGVDNGQLDLGR